MLNKKYNHIKGFTLIELLGVILILSLLLIIVFPNIINLVKNTNDNIDSTSEKLIFNATELYMKDNSDYYKTGGKYCINIEDLVQEDYIRSPLQYKESDDITENKSVLVSYKNNENVYEIIDKSRCKDSIAEINSKLSSDETEIFIDDNGNVRFRGKTPNNYVTFNNETWRIIGIVDGHLKLIRNESAAVKQWNADNLNDWTKSSLMKYLNPKDVSKAETDGEYWSNLTLEAKYMIEKIEWNLGGFTSNSTNTNNIKTLEAYTKERENVSYNNQPTTWEGYVGLMYPSDYGYAASEECMINKVLYQYNDEACKSSNWLYIGIHEWTQSPHSGCSDCVWYVDATGMLNYANNARTSNVRPVVNLKSTVKFIDGVGTSDKPYQLAM